MHRHAFALLLALAGAVPVRAQTAAPPITPPTPPTRSAADCAGPIALVLSGGGAKGLAHIGVLRALDSLGIRPDLVVGTSMGAIVGAMYASGYSGRQIDSLARALPLAGMLGTYAPRAPQALGPLQPLLVWEQGERGFALQSASVREAEVNALLNAAMLRGNLAARGDFDRLPIPFRAVAVDLRDRSAVVLARGDLARAVRASIAIPLIFPPERIGGRPLADGGLVANIPVAVARAAGARRVIVSDVTKHLATSPDSLDLSSPVGMADRLLDFLFQQPADSLGPGDVLVRPEIDGFGALGFGAEQVDRLVHLGARAADSALVVAGCAPPSSVDAPSARAPAQLPALAVRGVRVADTSVAAPIVARSLAERLGLAAGERLDPALLRRRLRALGESETYRAVWLQPRGRGDSVRFDLVVQRAPKQTAGLGLAYDNELGGRMWVGLVNRELVGRDVEWGGALFLGELRKELTSGVRLNSGFGRRILTPTITARGALEKVRQFSVDGDELDPLEVREAVGFAGFERSLGRGWLAAAGAEGRIWRADGLAASHAAGPLVRLSRVSRGNERTLLAEGVWTAGYRRATLDAAVPLGDGPVRLRPRVRLGWGEHLPPQLALPLGGDDGFPGLHIGERRGTREAMADLQATVALAGPLVLRLEGALGRAAAGGPLLGSDDWLVGARAGLGLETPVGPVRFEYGRASGGRGAVLVRLGRWF